LRRPDENRDLASLDSDFRRNDDKPAIHHPLSAIRFLHLLIPTSVTHQMRASQRSVCPTSGPFSDAAIVFREHGFRCDDDDELRSSLRRFLSLHSLTKFASKRVFIFVRRNKSVSTRKKFTGRRG